MARAIMTSLSAVGTSDTLRTIGLVAAVLGVVATVAGLVEVAGALPSVFDIFTSRLEGAFGEALGAEAILLSFALISTGFSAYIQRLRLRQLEKQFHELSDGLRSRIELEKSRRVFLSFSADDSDRVKRMRESLSATGFEVLTSNEIVGSGSEIMQSFLSQVSQVDYFVPVISKSYSGEFLKYEIDAIGSLLRDKGIDSVPKVVAALVEEAPRARVLERVRYVDVSDGDDSDLSAVLAEDT